MRVQRNKASLATAAAKIAVIEEKQPVAAVLALNTDSVFLDSSGSLPKTTYLGDFIAANQHLPELGSRNVLGSVVEALSLV